MRMCSSMDYKPQPHRIFNIDTVGGFVLCTTTFKNIRLFKRSCAYWCETEAGEAGLMEVLGKGPEKVLVVSNTYSRLFETFSLQNGMGVARFSFSHFRAVPPQEPSNHSRRSYGALKGGSRFSIRVHGYPSLRSLYYSRNER